MAVLRTAFLLLPLCQLFNADESEVQPKTGQINVTKNYKLYANLSGANWKIPEILEVNSFLINTETAAPETKEPLVPKALYKKPKREKQVRKKRKAEVVTTWSSTTLDLNYTNSTTDPTGLANFTTVPPTSPNPGKSGKQNASGMTESSEKSTYEKRTTTASKGGSSTPSSGNESGKKVAEARTTSSIGNGSSDGGKKGSTSGGNYVTASNKNVASDGVTNSDSGGGSDGDGGTNGVTTSGTNDSTNRGSGVTSNSNSGGSEGGTKGLTNGGSDGESDGVKNDGSDGGSDGRGSNGINNNKATTSSSKNEDGVEGNGSGRSSSNNDVTKPKKKVTSSTKIKKISNIMELEKPELPIILGCSILGVPVAVAIICCIKALAKSVCAKKTVHPQ